MVTAKVAHVPSGGTKHKTASAKLSPLKLDESEFSEAIGKVGRGGPTVTSNTNFLLFKAESKGIQTERQS